MTVSSVHRLRPLQFGDVDTLATWFESPTDLAMFTARQPLPLGAAALHRFWLPIIEGREPRDAWFFVVEDPTGQLVAFTGIEDVNLIHGTATTPLWVDRAVRSSGIGVVTRAMMLDLAFGPLGLHRINSLHRSDNPASRRINERCGLSPEGVMREGWQHEGKRVDVSLFGILAREWRAHRSVLAGALPDSPQVRFGNDERSAWPQAARE